MKKLRIVFADDAPYDEVVDSIADAFEAGIILEEQLEDGFQVSDLLAALQIQPKVQEIVNDVPVFLQQFTKLNGRTANAAVMAARDRITAGGKELGPVTNFLMRFLFVAANNYQYAIDSYEGGQRQFMLWQSLLNGGRLFPDNPV